MAPKVLSVTKKSITSPILKFPKFLDFFLFLFFIVINVFNKTISLIVNYNNNNINRKKIKT